MQSGHADRAQFHALQNGPFCDQSLIPPLSLNPNPTMITLNLQIPEKVAAEFYQAADELNQRFGATDPRIDAKSLMAFALARHESGDLCAQFDLALRLVRGPEEKPFNPALN